MLPFHHILQKYNVVPKGVIHVGSHFAQEHDEYLKMGVDYMVYIEPSKPTFEILLKKFGGKRDSIQDDGSRVVLFNLACGAEYLGMQPMNVSPFNEGQSNSLLSPHLHLEQHPEVKFTDTEMVEVQALDNLVIDYDKCNIIVADVQGYELEVLKGGVGRLKKADAVYIEVNRDATYSGNALIDDVDVFLLQHGFERVETYWPSPSWSWGDAIYISKTLL